MYLALLATTTGGPSLHTSDLVEWGVKNGLPILGLMIGIGIIANARKGRISENAGILTNVGIGCGVIAGSLAFYGFAGDLVTLIFGSS